MIELAIFSPKDPFQGAVLQTMPACSITTNAKTFAFFDYSLTASFSL
jgi:hypothetical protein